MLRALSFLPCLFVCGQLAAEEPAGALDYAPEAQGHIRPSIPKLLDDAKALGQAWREGLVVQEADSFGIEPDLESLRERALNNPRVRALLGADGGLSPGTDLEERYGSKQAFLLASFSMPPESLRTMMIESERFGVPIIMQGFVENSIFKTQEALQAVFGDDAQTVGFGIDPTLFTRFAVRSVPQFIIVKEPLEVCEAPGCAGEAPPIHDVVRGNIPIEAALDIIIRGHGETAEIAHALLERGRK